MALDELKRGSNSGMTDIFDRESDNCDKEK